MTWDAFAVAMACGLIGAGVFSALMRRPPKVPPFQAECLSCRAHFVAREQQVVVSDVQVVNPVTWEIADFMPEMVVPAKDWP